jgi:hypothetical protein
MLRLALAVAVGGAIAWAAVATAGKSPPTCQLQGALPDGHCTPGVRAPLSAAQVCALDPRAPAAIPHAFAASVYDRYGIAPRARRDHPIDELIPRALGGLVATRNLWPQPLARAGGPGVKRALALALRASICAGRLSLRAAQDRIAGDWVAASRRMRALAPLTAAPGRGSHA